MREREREHSKGILYVQKVRETWQLLQAPTYEL